MTTKEKMIEVHLKGRDIDDFRVLNAMEAVDRTLFVPEELEERAYEDGPLPIGKEQTISQPYIVAYMAQALQLWTDDKVLEIGTGCGYSAAVLSHLADKVYSVEIIQWLAHLAKENLNKTDIDNIETRFGNGYHGWPEEAPFDAIQLTAAPPRIPETLKRQLKIGGRLLAPVGESSQVLMLVHRRGENTFDEESLMKVNFVQMTKEVNYN